MPLSLQVIGMLNAQSAQLDERTSACSTAQLLELCRHLFGKLCEACAAGHGSFCGIESMSIFYLFLSRRRGSKTRKDAYTRACSYRMRW